MAIANNAEAEKRGYGQALVIHPQPVQERRETTIGVDQVHSQEEALTKRILRDNEWIDRRIDICPSC
jgi:hypothetical protein